MLKLTTCFTGLAGAWCCTIGRLRDKKNPVNSRGSNESALSAESIRREEEIPRLSATNLRRNNDPLNYDTSDFRTPGLQVSLSSCSSKDLPANTSVVWFALDPALWFLQIFNLKIFLPNPNSPHGLTGLDQPLGQGSQKAGHVPHFHFWKIVGQNDCLVVQTGSQKTMGIKGSTGSQSECVAFHFT